MAKRKIIKIDEEKCNGCGLCIPKCPEGAIQIIDKKARLISDLFCDGLGACIGYCPEGAITIEERDAASYDEKKVMENIVRQGRNTIKAHLEHLKSHGEEEYLKQAINFLKEKNIDVPLEQKTGHIHQHSFACPSVRVVDLGTKEGKVSPESGINQESQLSSWPVQITLVPVSAPYLKDADLLIAADCVPFAYAGFHQDLLKGKKLLIGCPKLDNIDIYRDKIGQILKNNNIKSITYAHMEVPCCFGLISVIQEAINSSGKNIPFREVVIGISGEKIK